ncbi:MAG TPA: ATP-binding protein [Fibrobacteria bacterium]|nr:ATP-binding protein [Fibrobacteria bacterium]
MTPFDSVAQAQEKLLRSAAWQILSIAAIQFALALASGLSSSWLTFSVLLAIVAAPALLSGRDTRTRSFAFILPLALFSLAAPWELGGLSHPICLLPVAAIHTAAFLLGIRPALFIGSASLLNILAMTLGERFGILENATPSIETAVLHIAVLTAHGMLFISTPLGLLRHLLTLAATDLSARRDNEAALHGFTNELEDKVARRTEALVKSRERLHRSVDEVATSMKASIQDLVEASREFSASFSVDDPEPRWTAFRISSGCERMETMHGALHRLCLLGEAALDLRPLSPEAHTGMVHRIWSEIKSIHPERTISFFLDPIPGCVCDADLLRQVWQNLLSNAAKFTSESQSACVKVYFRDGDFCVEDNGAGFDPESSDKLFGIFQHEKNDDGLPGQGVGLAMTRRILEMHGGSIQAEGKPGQGALFRFRIPDDPD